MKAIYSKAFFVFVWLFVFFGADRCLALEDRGGFGIRDFIVDIEIQSSGDLLVTENVKIEFSEKRHGIFRNIPVKYKDDRGFSHNLIISNVDVADGSSGGDVKFQKYKENGDLVLKIGDPDLEIDGVHSYKISYKVARAIRYFDDHSELYWNPIGTQWPTTIDSAKVSVVLPKSYVFADNDIICFEGAYGESSRHCQAVVSGTGRVEFSSSGSLNKYEGLTFAIKLPRGYFEEPAWWKNMLWFLAQNWGFLLPVASFFVMLFLWIQRGKELDLKKTVIPQYDVPDKLTPGEMNYLLKENYSQKAIVADIVNLAVKGFLKIREVSLKDERLNSILDLKKKHGPALAVVFGVVVMLGFVLPAMFSFAKGDFFAILFPAVMLILIFIFVIFANYKKAIKGIKSANAHYELEKTKDWSGDKELTEHEKKLLGGLFGRESAIGQKVALSELKDFYSKIPDVKESLKRQIKEKGYFENNVLNYKSIYVMSGVVIFFVLFILGSSLQRNDMFFGGFLSAMVFIGFGLAMSKKTFKGAEAYRYVQGFRLYVKTAEKYRVRFQEDNNIFEKVLPFAMVFGLAEKWGEVFEDIYKQDPAWYASSSAGKSFSALALSNSLDHGFSNATSSVVTPPSSSSSGFSGGSSGGGGGGGGGGSW